MTRLTSSVTALLCGLVTIFAIITFACAVLPCRVLARVDSTRRDHTATPGWIAFLSTRGGKAWAESHLSGSFPMFSYGLVADVFVIRPDGSSERQLSDDRYPYRDWAGKWAGKWSPAKSVLAWVGEKGVTATDLERGTTRLILPPQKPWYVRDMAWGPNGDRLAVITENLRIYDTAGKVLSTWAGPQGRGAMLTGVGWSSRGAVAVWLDWTRIWAASNPEKPDSWHSLVDLMTTPWGTIPSAFASPRWSPDGTTLLIEGSGVSDARKVWLLRADGTGLRPFCSDPVSHEFNASWSPDGRMIAYTRTDLSSGQPHVYTATVDGLSTRDYTPAGARADWPTWSPDGKTLAFAANTGAGWRIYVADAATGEARKISSGPKDDTFPVWGGAG